MRKLNITLQFPKSGFLRKRKKNRTLVIFKSCFFSLKVYQCRSENLQVPLSSHKNNMQKVSHYNIIYFLSYAHPRYMKYLFTNMQKQ